MSTEIRRRPNRAHGAIDKVPEEVRLQIRDWYLGRPEEDVPRLTYDQIATELKKLGYRISKNAVWRWIARQRNDLDRMQEMAARADALVRRLVPKGATVEAATVSLLQALLMESLSDAEIMQVKSIEDLTRVAHAAGRLQTSAVARDKWEHDKGQKITAAVGNLKASLQELIAKDAELLARLLELVDEASEAMMERVA